MAFLVSLMTAGCPDPLPPLPADDATVPSEMSAGEIEMMDMSMGGDIVDMNMGAEEADLGTLGGDEGFCQPCGEREGEGECSGDLTCFTHTGTEEQFCSISCEDDSACPTDYHCGPTPDASEGGSEGGQAGDEGMAGDTIPSSLRFCVPDQEERCEPKLCRDDDGDGYGRGPDCLGLDCDDQNPSVHYGNTEDLCDNLDNDCDELIDEDFVGESCGQGICAGSTQCVGGRIMCDGPEASGEDANCNALDEDCDGQVDEGYQPMSCGAGLCIQPSTCTNGVEACEGSAPTMGDIDSVCDLMDSDCDGLVDEGYVIGASVCGQGVCANRGSCTPQGEVCVENPRLGSDEDCDGLDNDCDGSIDEGFVSTRSCGLGVCRRAETCVEQVPVCIEGMSTDPLDQNCDGVDDNCDGIPDNRCSLNEITFSLIEETETSVTVAVLFNREVVNEFSNATLPALFELSFQHPSSLTLPPPTQRGTLGPVFAGFNFPPVVIDNDYRTNFVRVILPSGFPPDSYDRVRPGELIRFIFNKGSTTSGPYEFSWVRPEPFTDQNGNQRYDNGEPYQDVDGNNQRDTNCLLTPHEANAILSLVDAQLGGQ